MMAGKAIRKLRTDLGMTPADFAALLGVHPSSIYRWENADAEEVHIEPLQFRLLTVLQQEVNKRKTAQAQAELGKAIVGALIVGGALFGLFTLLATIFKEEKS